MSSEFTVFGENLARIAGVDARQLLVIAARRTEHLLAALYSCGVDNAYADLDAIEVPILDGSAQPFVEMLELAGLRNLRRRQTSFVASTRTVSPGRTTSKNSVFVVTIG